MSQQDIRHAVQTLEQAPDKVLFAVRTEVLRAFVRLRKRLSLPTDHCVKALDSLSAQKEKIKKITQDKVVAALSQISSQQADIRFQHIYAEQPGDKSFNSRVRAIFAYRSLGFEFDEYILQHDGISRVDELAKDYTKAENKSSGRMTEFLRDKGLDDRPSRNAVGFAIKLLVLEKIRNLPYISLADVSHLLSESGAEYSALGDLAKSSSTLVLKGQERYNASIKVVPQVIITRNSLVNQPRTVSSMERQQTSDTRAETDALEASSISSRSASEVAEASSPIPSDNSDANPNNDPSLHAEVSVVIPDVISHNHHTDLCAVSTEHHHLTNDLPPETERLETFIERNRVPSSQDGPGSLPSQSSYANPNLHGALSQNQFVGNDPASNYSPTSAPGQVIVSDDDGEGPRFNPSKRRKILSRPKGHTVQPAWAVASQPQGNDLNAQLDPSFPSTMTPLSYGLNTRSHTRWSPSDTDETPIRRRRQPLANTNFWSVVNDRAIGEATSHNGSSSVSNATNVLFSQSAVPQQHAQVYGHLDEQDEAQTLSPVRPSRSSVFNAHATPAGQPHHENHADSLYDQRPSSIVEQNQSSLANRHGSVTPTTQEQENCHFAQALRSGPQEHIPEGPTADSIAEGTHGTYWEPSATNSHSFRPWELNSQTEQVEQSLTWTYADQLEHNPNEAIDPLTLEPVSFLDFLPGSTPTQTLHPREFADFLMDPCSSDALPSLPESTGLVGYSSGTTVYSLQPTSFVEFLPSSNSPSSLWLATLSNLGSNCLPGSTDGDVMETFNITQAVC